MNLKNVGRAKEFDELIAHIRVACFGTTEFAGSLRSNQIKLRQEFREYIENLKVQVKALKEFKQAHRRNKQYGFGQDSIPVSYGFPDALKKAGLKMEGGLSGYQLSLDFIEDLVDEYLDRLELDNESGYWENDSFIINKIDALIYPHEVSKQAMRDDSVINSLLFHLSFLFRQYTSPESDKAWLKKINGEMPLAGQPQYGYTADIANAIFNLHANQDDSIGLSSKNVMERVSNLTKIKVRLGSLFDVDF